MFVVNKMTKSAGHLTQAQTDEGHSVSLMVYWRVEVEVLEKDSQSLSRSIWSRTPCDNSVPHPPPSASEVSVNSGVQCVYILHTMLYASEVLGKEFISHYSLFYWN